MIFWIQKHLQIIFLNYCKSFKFNFIPEQLTLTLAFKIMSPKFETCITFLVVDGFPASRVKTPSSH